MTAAFTQPEAHLLAEPCIRTHTSIVELLKWNHYTSALKETWSIDAASKCRRLCHLRNLATDWHWSSRVGRQFRHKGKLIVDRRKLAANLPTEVVCWCISDSLRTMGCIFTLSASSQIFKTHKGWHSYGSSYQKGFYTALSSKRRIAWSYWIPGLSLSFSSLSNTTYIWPLPFLCDNVVGKVWPRCLLVFCTCAVSPWNCERRDSSRRMNKPLLIIQGSKQPNVLPFLSWPVGQFLRTKWWCNCCEDKGPFSGK